MPLVNDSAESLAQTKFLDSSRESKQAHFTMETLPPLPPPLRPEKNALSSLMRMVDGILENDRNQVHFNSTLELIATHDGEFGRTYRPQLFQALYHFQYASGSQLSTTSDSQRLVDHLSIVEDLIIPYGINEMHQGEKLGWAKLMNQHLCYLSFVPKWTELQTTHLRLATSILEKVLFNGEHEVSLPKDRLKELTASVSPFLDTKFSQLLSDVENSESRACLISLLTLAGQLRAPELREPLQSAFWQINTKCSQFAPADFGTGMNEYAEGEDEFDDEEEDDGSIALDDRAETSGGYQILQEEDLTFEDRYGESTEDLMEDLTTAHDRLLSDLIDTPGADPDDTFWRDVLSRNSLENPSWKIAAHGLPSMNPMLAQEVLSELVEASVTNSLAVAHLLDIMALGDTQHDTSASDMSTLIISLLKELPRRDQRQILKSAKSVIDDVCELLEYADDASFQLSKIKKVLNAG